MIAKSALLVLITFVVYSHEFTVPLREVKITDNGLAGYIPRRRDNLRAIDGENQGHEIQKRSSGPDSESNESNSDENRRKSKGEEEDMDVNESRYGYFGGGPYDRNFQSFLPFPPQHHGPHPGPYSPPFGHHNQFPCHGPGCNYGYGHGHGNDFGHGYGHGNGHGYVHGNNYGHGHGHGYGHGYEHGHRHEYEQGNDCEYKNEHHPQHGHHGHGHKPDNCDDNSNENESMHSTSPPIIQPTTEKSTTTTTTTTTTTDPIYDIDVRLGSK